MRDLMIMIGFLGFLPIALSRPFVGLLVWTWLTIMSPHRETFGFAYSFNFNAIIFVVTLIGLMKTKDKINMSKNFLIYIMLIFFVWNVVTCFTALDSATSWIFFNSAPSRTFIYAFFIMLLVDSEERLISLLWMIIISLGYYGASIGIVGILAGGRNIGTAENFGPTNTIIGDRNHMAVALLMIFPLLIYFAKYSEHLFVKYSVRFVSFLTFITIIVSYSRTGLVCLFLVAGYYFTFLKNKIAILLLFFVVFSISFSFMPQEWQDRMSLSSETIEKDKSLSVRFFAWDLATRIANDRPFVGGGYRIVQNANVTKFYEVNAEMQKLFAAHSIYFEVLSDHGYVGLILFLSMLLSGIYINFSTRKITKSKPEYRWVFDLSTAFNLSIAVYMLGGSMLSLAYYDLIYVIILCSAILNIMINNTFSGKKKTSKQFIL